jgi:copper oxidase (laccase) domain-containing protein
MRFELPGGDAVFTTRADGNLSASAGAGHERGLRERARLCEQLRLRWLCAGRQVHGAIVQRVREQSHSGGQPLTSEADGRATGLERVGVMVLSADCLPVLVGCERAVAAVHAGWRGLAAGVLEEGVRAVRELAGARGEEISAQRPSDGRAADAGRIVAIIGPCAGPCCYQVGPEVHAAFSGAHRHGRNLDLPALARERLLEAGADRVEQAGICTICDQRFFSHRRESSAAGRQAGIAWLR